MPANTHRVSSLSSTVASAKCRVCSSGAAGTTRRFASIRATGARRRAGSLWTHPAWKKLERKRTECRDGELPQTGHQPKFDDFACQYLDGPALAQKKEGTQQNERQAIGRWSKHLDGVRVDKITPQIIYGYRVKRPSGGASARTVNLDAVALRNVLKLAAERGLIEHLPAVKQLK